MKDHGWNIPFLLAAFVVRRKTSVLILIMQLIHGTVCGQPQGKGASVAGHLFWIPTWLGVEVGWLRLQPRLVVS